MDPAAISISEEWIRKKLNITHDNLDDIKSLSLPGSYQEKLSHLGSSLHKFTRLKELDLSRNVLSSLDGLEHLKYLEKLNLYYNNIASLKELEKLRFNSGLAELDLRLNPITKEENDYRLYLIHLLPSLKLLDDRSIRDSERQMAATYFDQANFIPASVPRDLDLNNHRQSNQKQNGCNNNDLFQPSSAVIARVKSVTNIAKRSAGLNDKDTNDAEANFSNFLNLRMHENSNDFNHQNNKPPVEEYSPRTLKEISNLESQSYNNASSYNNSNGHQAESNAKESSIRSRSYSLQNLRTVNNNHDNQNNSPASPAKSKSVHFSEVTSYHDLNYHRSTSDNHLNNFSDESEAYNSFKSRGSFTPNPFYEHNDQQQHQTNEKQTNKSNKTRRISRDLDGENDLNQGKNQSDEQQKNNPLFLLLDLVDRYWNGSKSLHKNFKFLGAAQQLLQQCKYYPNDESIPQDEKIGSIQLRQLQEENKRLQQQLYQKPKQSDSDAIRNSNELSDLQNKNLIQEIELLKKKLNNYQDENKKLRKELAEKNEKSQKDFNLETIESQNGSMKRDIEIMRIKLKQYEQLQQLTAMLQESHKSLVTTNEHLLQEINFHKRELKSNGANRYVQNPNDANSYSPNVSASHESVGASIYINGGVQPNLAKPTVRKQFEQLNNSYNTRYSYSMVK